MLENVKVRKNIVRIVSMVLAILTLFIISTTSFASNNVETFNVKGTDEVIQVNQLSENSTIVIEGENSHMITFTEKDNIFTTTIRDLHTGEEEYLIRDDNANTLHSTITGYTGNIEDIEYTEEDLDYSTMSAGDKRNFQVKSVRTSDLANYVGLAAGAAQIASGFMSLAKLSIAGLVGAIIDILSGAGVFSAYILQRDYRLLSVLTYEIKRKKMQGGKPFYFWTKTHDRPYLVR